MWPTATSTPTLSTRHASICARTSRGIVLGIRSVFVANQVDLVEIIRWKTCRIGRGAAADGYDGLKNHLLGWSRENAFERSDQQH